MQELFAKILNNRALKALGPFSILIAVFVILLVSTPTFRDPNNILQVLLSASVYVMLAMGMTFVMVGGCIDLSMGSIVGLSGTVCLLVLRQFQAPLWVAVVAGVIAGMICGAVNGFMVTKMGLISFIATLGSMWIFRGALQVVSSGQTVTVRRAIPKQILESLQFLGSGRVLGIPVPVYIFVILAVILSFILRRTTFGRSLYAVGSNPEAARMSGISNKWTIFKSFVLGDALAGLAGVLLAARMVSVQANSGDGYEFEGIFASVVGGTSMAGGEGTILGSLVGACVIALLRNGLNLNGINSFWQRIILGVIIVIAVYVDTLRTRRSREGA
ncbi:MAG: ABC transporter permease [Planctomycetota bacterium]|jgi:ribose transport system permease protein|nr:ABC transporter permease [Planctomycetota bacterium]